MSKPLGLSVTTRRTQLQHAGFCLVAISPAQHGGSRCGPFLELAWVLSQQAWVYGHILSAVTHCNKPPKCFWSHFRATEVTKKSLANSSRTRIWPGGSKQKGWDNKLSGLLWIICQLTGIKQCLQKNTRLILHSSPVKQSSFCRLSYKSSEAAFSALLLSNKPTDWKHLSK